MDDYSCLTHTWSKVTIVTIRYLRNKIFGHGEYLIWGNLATKGLQGFLDVLTPALHHFVLEIWDFEARGDWIQVKKAVRGFMETSALLTHNNTCLTTIVSYLKLSETLMCCSAFVTDQKKFREKKTIFKLNIAVKKIANITNNFEAWSTFLQN